MSDLFQKTILKQTEFKSIGLHTGFESRIKILPAEANYGIVFKRTDLEKNNIIKANFKNVSSAKLCTTIQNKFGVSVSTVEHLLAALYITGIDNALIEINSIEVPIMDGSSKEFVETIFKTGVKEQKEKRKYLKILKKFEFQEKEKFISIEPNDNSLNVDFELVYSNNVIGKQRNQINFSDKDLSNVYTSRTFCLFEDIEEIKKIGLAKGGSLDNAIVVKDDKILNEEGLRNKKEFVNHKILDCMGDLYLTGYKIIGKIFCSQGGHKLTNQLLRKVFQQNENFSLIEITEKHLPSAFVNKSHLKSIA